MTISRRDLYAMGEPLGESATERRPDGRYRCGGGGSSSSQSSTTQNTDKRIAVEQGIGISSDSSTISVQALDAGIVGQALETVQLADATAGDGFNRLLGLADKLFATGSKVLETGQATTLAQVGALSQAQTDAKGNINQNTMVILAIAGVAAAYALKGK